MSSLTPLQLQQLMVGGGVSPSLVAQYGQRQGIMQPQMLGGGLSDADILQTEIAKQNAQKQERDKLQHAMALHSAAIESPGLISAMQAAAPGIPPPDTSSSAALPVGPTPPPAQQQQPPTQQEIMAMQTLSAPDYGNAIGGVVSQFAAESNAYTKNMRSLAASDAKLIDDTVKIKSARDMELAKVEGERAGIANNAAAQMAAAQDTEKGVEERVNKEMGDLYKDYRKAADIDPNRLIKNQSTAGSILGFLSVAIGGGAAGITGGPNRAADAIETRINQDIRAQIEKRNGLKDLIDEKRAELGDARAKALGIANMVNLEAAQRMIGAAAKAGQIEKNADSKLQRSAAGMVKNDLLQKAENNIISVKKDVTDLRVKALAHQGDMAAQSLGLMLKQGAAQGLPNQVVPIGPIQTETPKIVSAKIAEYNALQSHLAKAEDLRAKAGKSGRWQGQEKQDALEAAKRAFNAERKYTGSGAALSPKETELIEMKNPNSFTIGLFDDVLGQISARRTALKRDLAGYLQGYNVMLRSDAQEQQDIQGGSQH